MSSEMELRRLVEAPPGDVLERPLKISSDQVTGNWSDFFGLANQYSAANGLNQLAALLDLAYAKTQNEDHEDQSNIPVHLQHRIFEMLPSGKAAEFFAYAESRLNQWRSSTIETVLATTRLLRTKIESPRLSGRACFWVSTWVPLYKQPILFPKNADIELPDLPEGAFWDLQTLLRTACPAKIQELLQAMTTVRNQRNHSSRFVELRVGRIWNTEPEVLDLLLRDPSVWRIVGFQVLSVLQSLNLPSNSPYISRVSEMRKVWQAILRDSWPSENVTVCDAFYEKLLSRDRDWIEAALKKRMPDSDIAELVEPKGSEGVRIAAEANSHISDQQWEELSKPRPKYFNSMGNVKLSRIWKIQTGLDNVEGNAHIEESKTLDTWSRLRITPILGEVRESKTRETIEALNDLNDEPDIEDFSDESEWEAESDNESSNQGPDLQEKNTPRKRRFDDTERPSSKRPSEETEKVPSKRFKGGNKNAGSDKYRAESKRDIPRRDSRRGEPKREPRRERESRRDPKKEPRGTTKWDQPSREIPRGPSGTSRRGGELAARNNARGGRPGLPRRPSRSQQADGGRAARPTPRSY